MRAGVYRGQQRALRAKGYRVWEVLVKKPSCVRQPQCENHAVYCFSVRWKACLSVKKCTGAWLFSTRSWVLSRLNLKGLVHTGHVPTGRS